MSAELTRSQVAWRYRIFILTWFGYAGFYLCRKNISIIAPEMGLTKIQYANYIFAYSLAYCIGQFVSGILSDRYGPRKIVGTGLFLSALANFFMGFTGTMFVLMVLLGSISGLGQSTGWSGLVKNMACWFRRKERGIVMAWWATNYVLGGAIATAVATFCIYRFPFFVELGWRRGFFIPALLLSIVALCFVLFSRNRPSDVGLPDFPEDGESETNDDSAEANSEVTQDTSLSIIVELLSKSSFWIISIMYFFLKMIRYAFLFWLPFYMLEKLGYGGEEAGYTSAMFELVGFTGAIAAGYFSDKIFRSRRFPVGSLFLFCLAICFFIHPTIASYGHFYNAIGIGLIGFFVYGPDSLMTGAAAQDEGSQRGAATAAGFINGIGSMGQMISGYVVASITDVYSWDTLFNLFAAIVFANAIFLALKWNYVPSRSENSA